MGLTSKQREAKAARAKIRELLTEYNMHNKLMCVGFRRVRPGIKCLLFSTRPQNYPSTKLFREARHLLDAAESGLILIQDIDDNVMFDNLEEYRRYILVKELSGVQ